MSRVLYVSYDGILEPLGRSQVLCYLERLAEDHEISLISFEKASDWASSTERSVMQKCVREAGIRWSPLRYHLHPSALATAFDIFQGIVIGAIIILRRRIEIVHARSYVASVMALVLRVMFRVKFVFDMRGFWADERIDGGIWRKNSYLYCLAKWFERRFLSAADIVVSLTHVGAEEMRRWPSLRGKALRIEVITTCTDLELFRPASEVKYPARQATSFTLGYVGTVGVWYLFDEVLICFDMIRKRVPAARLHILNRGEHAFIWRRLSEHGIDPEAVTVEATDHIGVVEAMQKMTAGIFFIKPAYSKLASAPTKLGEFLGCGVPCLTNYGVGDMGAILEENRVGVAVHGFDMGELQVGVDKLFGLVGDSNIAARCRETAVRQFSIEEGVESYLSIYRTLILSS